jgi:pectinesterase
MSEMEVRWRFGPMTWLCVVTTLSVSLGTTAICADHPVIIVAPDGSGHFKTIQSAIDSVPDENKDSRVIIIKPGIYKERLLISESKTFITLRGEHKHATKTVLTFNRYWGMEDPAAPGKKVETNDVESVSIHADNFTAENITFENSSGEVGQAPAVRTRGDKQSFRNCRFLGWQDTLWIGGGRTYFKNCYVEGCVDFIFGDATAVFENCQIHSKKGGFVTAAGTKPELPFGFVFLKCKLTGMGGDAYLGRPWQKSAATAFIECELGNHLRPEGWSDAPGTDNHKTARFVEHKNTGPGADTSERPDWTRQLSDAEAQAYTIENILSGEDRWNPQR